MAENPSGPTEPLDVQQIHYLVRLMKRYDLTALDVRAAHQIRLRRKGPRPSQRRRPASSNDRCRLPPHPAIARRHAPSRRPPSPPPASKTIVIESPMVGTYYASSSPDAPPFVTVGSVVRPTRPSASSRR